MRDDNQRRQRDREDNAECTAEEEQRPSPLGTIEETTSGKPEIRQDFKKRRAITGEGADEDAGYPKTTIAERTNSKPTERKEPPGANKARNARERNTRATAHNTAERTGQENDDNASDTGHAPSATAERKPGAEKSKREPEPEAGGRPGTGGRPDDNPEGADEEERTPRTVRATTEPQRERTPTDTADNAEAKRAGSRRAGGKDTGEETGATGRSPRTHARTAEARQPPRTATPQPDNDAGTRTEQRTARNTARAHADNAEPERRRPEREEATEQIPEGETTNTKFDIPTTP